MGRLAKALSARLTRVEEEGEAACMMPAAWEHLIFNDLLRAAPSEGRGRAVDCECAYVCMQAGGVVRLHVRGGGISGSGGGFASASLAR